MATLEEWGEHFGELDGNRREELRKALEALEADPMMKKEFGWSGLFALKWDLQPQAGVTNEEKPSANEPNIELAINLANLIVADAQEVLPAHTDEAEAQEDALHVVIIKAEKIVRALKGEAIISEGG